VLLLQLNLLDGATYSTHFFCAIFVSVLRLYVFVVLHSPVLFIVPGTRLQVLLFLIAQFSLIFVSFIHVSRLPVTGILCRSGMYSLYRMPSFNEETAVYFIG